MIVEWTKNCVKVISAKGKRAQLLPGNNEIKTEDWKVLREHVLGQIESKIIIEHEVSLDTIEKKTGGGKVIGTKTVLKEAKEFLDLDAKAAIALVKKTSSLETLQKWHDEETRESVLTALMKRIDAVKNYIPAANKKAE